MTTVTTVDTIHLDEALAKLVLVEDTPAPVIENYRVPVKTVSDYVGSVYYRIHQLLSAMTVYDDGTNKYHERMEDAVSLPIKSMIFRTFYANPRRFFDRMESFGYLVGNDAAGKVLTLHRNGLTTVLPYGHHRRPPTA